MSWQIKPFSRRCHVCGEAFQDGERYTSFLVNDPESGELTRFDVGEAETEAFQPEGELVCRWSRAFREEADRGPNARQQRETVESVFMSLFEGEADGEEQDVEERETLKQVLGVFLERKRVLKDRGFAQDGAFQVMEHRRSGNVYLVPTGRMTSELLPRIQEKLGELIF